LKVLGELISMGVLILIFCFGFEFFLPCRFSCLLLTFVVFLLLDDLLQRFVGFWSSICASWGLAFELQTLCLLLSMDSLRGR
jgi:hypothetical protein